VGNQEAFEFGSIRSERFGAPRIHSIERLDQWGGESVYSSHMEPTKILKYTVMFEKTTEGGYVAYVPLLPGCMTQGDTFEDVKENIKDAISGYLEVLREDGDDIPLEHEERIAATVTVPVLMNA